MKRQLTAVRFALLGIFLLGLCAGAQAATLLLQNNLPGTTVSSSRAAQVATPTASAVPSPLPPTATPTVSTPTLYIDPAIGGALRATIEQVAQTQKLDLVTQHQQAAVAITTKANDDPLLLNEQVYAVADRFATLRTGIRFADVRALWSGQALTGTTTLLLTAETAEALMGLLGAPGATVQQVPPEQLVDQLWKTPNALALIPFDQLTPRLLALPVDGQSVLDRRTDMAKYPLAVRVYVEGNPAMTPGLFNALHDQVAATNRDVNAMTSIVMTGVTAMGRFTADAIDKSGDPAFPARVVADILSQADITHVSNEIPFVENCPPNLVHDSIVLCSKPEYIETFKVLGADIVGLTGNHAGDFGYDNYVFTLELYEKNGIKHYAGGRDEAEARTPLIITDHGNCIAFLGANSFGPQSYWATPKKAGTNGYDAAKMKADIATAREQADLVFVEYQADEVYDYKPDATNVTIFRRTIQDGADVVTGVQNHHPASVEFQGEGKKIILYGLGNFSFDQMYSEGVRQGLIPRHTLYQGRLLQTELLTTMIEHYAQPRWATPAERETILRAVFTASGFAVQ